MLKPRKSYGDRRTSSLESHHRPDLHFLHKYCDLQQFWATLKDFINLTKIFENLAEIFENLTRMFELARESVTNRSGVKNYMDIVIWGIFWVFPQKLPDSISFRKKLMCEWAKYSLISTSHQNFDDINRFLTKNYIRPVFLSIFHSRIPKFEKIYDSFFY